jgi:hypothetical protein
METTPMNTLADWLNADALKWYAMSGTVTAKLHPK